MRKAIMFNLITLDGYFEGSNKWDIGWHRVDDEFNEFAVNQLHQAGGLIFGRVTYQGMASYWSGAEAIKDDPVVAELMNAIPKFVFTNSLDRAEWNNTQVIKGDAVEGLTMLKAQPGNDLYIFGSAQLSSTFTKSRLIDEYRLIVNPVVLGRGGPLFDAEIGTLKLNLLDLKTFRNGNVLLYYQPDGK